MIALSVKDICPTAAWRNLYSVVRRVDMVCNVCGMICVSTALMQNWRAQYWRKPFGMNWKLHAEFVIGAFLNGLSRRRSGCDRFAILATEGLALRRFVRC